jgi:hypothetical protein
MTASAPSSRPSTVYRVQLFRVPAGALDAAVDPAQERLRLGQRPQVDQRPRGHRGVADPAVAVVPVPDAADLLRQRGGGGGQDGAGRLVAESAQGEGAAQHQVTGDAGQFQRAGPVAPRLLDFGQPVADADRGVVQAVRAEPQLAGDLAADGREVDGGPGVEVAALRDDIPLDAGGEQRDRFGGTQHQQAVRHRLQARRDLPELRPWRELQPDPDVPGQRAHQRRVGASGEVGALQPVGDGQVGPAGLHGHRAGAVPLPERDAAAFRRDGEVPGRGAADEIGEDRRRVRPGVAQPADLGVRGDQGDGTAVRQHRVPLDRHRVLAVQPGAAGLQQQGEHPGAVQRLGDPVTGGGVARSDLDADVRSPQGREPVLVGDVVAEEQHRAGRQLGAQLVEGAALVGGQHRQLDHLLAVLDVHAGPGPRAGADRVDHGGGHLGCGGTHVHGDAGRFALQPYPRTVRHDHAQRGLEPRTHLDQVGGEPLDEAHVELGAVAADQMHLAGQP